MNHFAHCEFKNEYTATPKKKEFCDQFRSLWSFLSTRLSNFVHRAWEGLRKKIGIKAEHSVQWGGGAGETQSIFVLTLFPILKKKEKYLKFYIYVLELSCRNIFVNIHFMYIIIVLAYIFYVLFNLDVPPSQKYVMIASSL